jgi:predicted phage-related endonuclease
MNINEIMRELAQYIRLQEEAAATVEALKDQIKQYMTENQLDTLAGDEHKATYKAVSSSRVDTAALKRDHPDIATAYTKKTETKRFTFA